VSARVFVLLAAGVVLAAALAVIAQPHISALIGRWEVQSALNSLRIPNGWTMTDAPVEHVLADGGVLLSIAYSAPLDASPSARFVERESADGWQVFGGAPDGSTVLLRRGDLSLALATLSDHLVRVEIARYR
jgi:hypothetical protein